MHVTGGLYHEIIAVPIWCSIFGSGGRAALAIAAVSPEIHLHTYISPDRATAANRFAQAGVELHTTEVPTGIAFTYAHPLAIPTIIPSPVVKLNASINVEADVVLRFGMLEGDAIVDAQTAIYDPQGEGVKQSFGANGSRAKRMAIVLNEEELCHMGCSHDLDYAARKVMNQEGATLIIAKCGARGAYLFEEGKQSQHVAPYRTDHVFKLGTGDVFSAIFAFYWGKKSLPAYEAATIASRTVGAYCTTKELSASPDTIQSSQAVNGRKFGVTKLVGIGNGGLGQRYILEQARSSLECLGAVVDCPEIDVPLGKFHIQKPTALLIVAMCHSELTNGLLHSFVDANIPLIVYADHGSDRCTEELMDVDVYEDFTTAVYQAAWASLC